MSKRIIVVVGSPRIGRNTDRTADAFIKGAEDAGNSVFKFSLAQNKVAGCLHCSQCGKNGFCVQKDGMELFYPEYLKADMIVIASPIYFWQINAQTKCFIDRLYALYMTKQNAPKDLGIILCAGGSDDSMFTDAVSFLEHAFIDRLGWKNKGILKVNGTSAPDFDLEKNGFLKNAYNFGASVK